MKQQSVLEVGAVGCAGRCQCHGQAWQILDQAAGVPRHPGGPPPMVSDAEKFKRDLWREYRLEQADLVKHGRKGRPSLRRMGPRLLMDRRTLRRTLDRLGIPWPPLECAA